MATDRDEVDCTEAPSPRWVTRAQESGNWPQSGELVVACAMLAGLVTIQLCGTELSRSLANLLAISLAETQPVGASAWESGAWGLIIAPLLQATPLLIAPAAIAVIGCVSQTGMQFQPAACGFDPSRFNGLQSFGRLFSWQTLGASLTRTAKWFACVGLLAWWVWHDLQSAGTSARHSTREELCCWNQMCLGVGIKMACVFVLFGLLDYLLAWRSYFRQLGMSRSELMAEMRETEGDPSIRRRRRQRQVDSTYKRRDSVVEPGDLVVIGRNRTAVAIRLDGNGGGRVLLKGLGSLADTVRSAARSRGARIVQDERLTREILQATGAGGSLPAGLAVTLQNLAASNGRHR